MKPKLLTLYSNDSIKTNKFLLISVGLHGLMLALLFVPSFLVALGLRSPEQANLVKKFNVELVDVTMEDIAFNPKDFENLKSVKSKIKKSAQDQPKELAKKTFKTTVDPVTDRLKLREEVGVEITGQDTEDFKGAGEQDGETRRVLMSYKDYLTNYLNSSKEYPRIAEKLRQEGMVVLELEIDAKGLIKDLKIKKSSNFKVLDTAALNHVKSLSPFKELPSSAMNYRVEVPIVYQIN